MKSQLPKWIVPILWILAALHHADGKKNISNPLTWWSAARTQRIGTIHLGD